MPSTIAGMPSHILIGCWWSATLALLLHQEMWKKLQGETSTPYRPEEVKFGGVLGMLDVADRVKPITELDAGRMRWACELLDQGQKFNKVLGDIAVRGEFTGDDTWSPASLRRVERDAEIDVVLLSLYWHKPEQNAEHPLKNLCRDLVFSAQQVGTGLELDIERFKRRQDEEKKKVMGRTVWRVAMDLKQMAKAAESQREGRNDPDLLAHILSTRPELAKEWKSGTRGRYLAVANKINDKCKQVLNRWEVTFQRNILLDGITLFRAAATACNTDQEFLLLIETLYFEQVCKLRRSIAPKGRGHATDATHAMRGILLRHALYQYLRQIFPKLSDAIEYFGKWQWYQQEYGMSETGHLTTELQNDSDDDPDTPGKIVRPSSEDPSRFASKQKLIRLCTAVAKGRYDWAFTGLGKYQGHAMALDLSVDPMKTMKAKIQEVWTDYIAEFPPDKVPDEMPNATFNNQGTSAAQPVQVTEIKATSRIEN